MANQDLSLRLSRGFSGSPVERQARIVRLPAKRRNDSGCPVDSEDSLEDGLVVVTRGVAHDHHAQRFFRVDAHHIPETSPAAEVLDEGRAFVPGFPRAEPAQSEVPLSSPWRNALHLGHRPGPQESRAVHLAAVQVEHDEPGGLVDAPYQSAIGRSLDVEGVEGDVSPLSGAHYASW